MPAWLALPHGCGSRPGRQTALPVARARWLNNTLSPMHFYADTLSTVLTTLSMGIPFEVVPRAHRPFALPVGTARTYDLASPRPCSVDHWYPRKEALIILILAAIGIAGHDGPSKPESQHTT